MLTLLIRKIRRYPIASMVISGLTGMVITYESGYLKITGLSKTNTEFISTTKQSQPKQASKDVFSVGHETVADTAQILQDVEETMVEDTKHAIEGLDPELARLLIEKEFGSLREALLELAAIAVSDNDKNRLGYVLNLLGQISIQEQDLYSAEVFLTEALDIFSNLEDEIGSAQIYLQLGRTHLKSRQIARTAGSAYDELQVGRWYLANDIFETAEEYIRKSIQKNLSVNRYGAAASAYESLAKLFLKRHDHNQVKQNAFESARMYAASGQINKARQVLSLIPESLSQDWQLAQLETEINDNYLEYKEGILQIERARDYRRLYHYYKNQGDQKRAWKFRLLANNSLGQVSKRALFHRQQGVLAVLYNSNESIDLAEDYFSRAKDAFDDNGLSKLSGETASLNQQVQ